MGSVAVVTDSVANLPPCLAEERGIHVAPMRLQWDGQTYLDGVDLEACEMYRRLRQSQSLPTSSAPSVGDFVRVYTELSRSSDCIVSSHVAYELSAFHQAATNAADVVESLATVHVIDTGTAAMGQGLAVLEAARTAERGGDWKDVVQGERTVGDRACV